MAINNARMQQLRGLYGDFDKSKALPGEFQVVIANDPAVPSGKTLYIAFAAGDVRRLVSIEDIEAMVAAGEFKGEKGDKGDTGKSAYESAKEAGYAGTEAEFNADLAAMQGLADKLAEI